jgi:hypothetical protein
VMVLACLAVLIAFVAITARRLPASPLDVRERIYLWAAPLPVVLSLLLPAPLRLLSQGGAAPRAWGIRLSQAGGWLSVALIVAGTLLLMRRSGQRQPWDRRLVLGLVVAALPAVLVGLVALIYAIPRGG